MLCSQCRALVRLAGTVLAAAAAGATAAAMQAAIDWLVGWRNTTLQRFFGASLLQVTATEPQRLADGWSMLDRPGSARGSPALPASPVLPALAYQTHEQVHTWQQTSPPPPAAPWQAYAAHLAISCCLVLGAAGSVQAYAPRAAGGGVTW